MSSHLPPFVVVLELIGRPEEIGPICGLHRKTPYAWRFGSSAHDPDDVPSARYMRALLRHSDAHGLGLRPEHLIFGAEAAEIEAILAARASDQVAAQ